MKNKINTYSKEEMIALAERMKEHLPSTKFFIIQRKGKTNYNLSSKPPKTSTIIYETITTE